MQEKIEKAKLSILERVIELSKKATVGDMYSLTSTIDAISGTKTDPVKTLLEVMGHTQTIKEKGKK